MTIREFKLRRRGLILSPDASKRRGGEAYSSVEAMMSKQPSEGLSETMRISRAALECLRIETSSAQPDWTKVRFLRELTVRPLGREETKNILRRAGIGRSSELGLLRGRGRDFERVDIDVAKEVLNESGSDHRE